MIEKVKTRRSHDILQNMQNLTRLVISLREADDNENAQLLQFLHPEKFDTVLQCTKKILNFGGKRGRKEIGTPSLALMIGYALKKCISIV